MNAGESRRIKHGHKTPDSTYLCGQGATAQAGKGRQVEELSLAVGAGRVAD